MRPLLFILLLGGLLLPLSAGAYPWMIKHNYVTCSSCHLDPSGSGLLTPYGRAQQQLLVETQWTAPKEEGEVSPTTGFLYGTVPTPEWLLAGISARPGFVFTRTVDPASGSQQDKRFPIVMVADARAGVVAGPLRASVSLGVAPKGARRAALTRVDEGDGFKLVSREHWLGLSLAEDALLLRAGRLNVPFGYRNPEHILWARVATRTDYNEHQQHGVAAAWNGETVRAEVMALLGNYQLHPDVYRERGGAGYVEYAFAPNLAAGLSAQATYAQGDLEQRDTQVLRQSYGLMGRWGPTEALSFLGELNGLVRSSQEDGTQLGGVGYLQADLEVVRGLHLIGTVEALRLDRSGQQGLQLGGWLSGAWFFTRGAELRVDGYVRQIPLATGTSLSTLTALVQLHLYL